MTATTSTTIRGVSILSRDKRPSQNVFELVLSREGIEVRRPQRRAQQLSWDRVSEWEIEDRTGYVLLTLRGQGATTPLVVPGWSLDDLEILMRDVTGGTAHDPNVPEPAVADTGEDETSDAVAVAPPPGPVAAPPATSDAPAPSVAPSPAQWLKPGARGERRRLSWRVVVTVVLLGVLATAVILVLLQSAGAIDWSFLGPVA